MSARLFVFSNCLILGILVCSKSVAADTKGVLLDPVDVGPGCTYTSIQTAINNGFTDLRVVNGTYNESVSIANANTTISGGYSNCTNASNGVINLNAGPDSITIASNSDTISVSGTLRSSTVNLRNMTLTSDGGIFPGRGLEITGDNYVYLSSVRITESGTLNSGGGVSVIGASAALGMRNTQIDNNFVAIPLRAPSAPEGGVPTGGGGIYCQNSRVVIDEGSLINANSAQYGGGILADNCDVKMLSGDAGETLLFFFDGVQNNTATEDGGGIYAANGSDILISGGISCPLRSTNSNTKGMICDGSVSGGAVMLNNTADSNSSNSGDGGAIYATGPGTQVTIYNAVISVNSAYNGGGIAVANSANLGVSRAPGGSCWSDVGYDCVGFYSNTATNYGGAFWIGTGGSSIIAQSYISGNTAGFLGSALYGTNSSNSLEGNFIVNNGSNPIRGGGGVGTAQNVIRLYSGSLILAHTTMADNNATNQLIAISDGVGPGDLEFHHNAINNPGVDIFNFTAGATFNGSCSELHEIATVPDTNGMDTIGSDFFTGTDDDPYTSLYHTQNNSEAEDACGAGTYFPLFGDIDGEPRGWDNPAFIDLAGPYDIGADETYLGDVIFRDNFGFASIILR